MPERPTSGRPLAVAVGLVILVAAVALAIGWVREERDTLVSVPQPSPLNSTEVVPIGPGERVCLRRATFLPEGEVATIRVGTRGQPAVPLTATASGPGGYRSEATIGDDWRDNDALSFRIDPPSRPLHGAFCVRNDGPRTIDVYAAPDALTAARTFVEGRPVGANIQLAIRTAGPKSVLDRADDIVRSLTLFRPGVVVPVLVWLLVALTLLALTVGPVWIVWRAVGEISGPPEPDRRAADSAP